MRACASAFGQARKLSDEFQSALMHQFAKLGSMIGKKHKWSGCTELLALK